MSTQRHRKTRTKKVDSGDLVRRHLRMGWLLLLVFLTLGFALEVFHGLKLGIYLDVSNETRRLMWTLAHAHGALLALLHIAFALTVHMLPDWGIQKKRLTSSLLTAAAILIPAGFFLGGVFIHHGDPGLGVILVPFGAVALFVAVLSVARAAAATNARR